MPLGHRNTPASGQRFDPEEQVGFAQALVLIVLLGRLSGLHRERALGRGTQFLAALVEANDRTLRVIRPLVDIENVFHLGDIAGRGGADAPGLYLPGLERVFFIRSQTVVWSIVSTNPSSRTRDVSRRTVQRAWPSGGSLQAMTAIWASMSPVILGVRPGRGFSTSAAASPSERKRRRTLPTVVTLHKRASATCWSVRNCPWLRSVSSRIRARVCTRAGVSPLLRPVSSSARCAGVR